MSNFVEEQVNNATFAIDGEEIINPTVPNWLSEVTSNDETVLGRIPTSLPLQFFEGGIFDKDSGLYALSLNSGNHLTLKSFSSLSMESVDGISLESYDTIEVKNLSDANNGIEISSLSYILASCNGTNYYNPNTTNSNVAGSFKVGKDITASGTGTTWLEYEGERNKFSLPQLGLEIQEGVPGQPVPRLSLIHI